MLGALNRERKVRPEPPDDIIDRLEETLREVAYAAPECVDARRAEVIARCRAIIRIYRGQA